jgi:DNA anti-recombination protein RmuC
VNIEALKSFDPVRYDLDEMLSLRAYATSLEAQYAEMGLEAPEWLKDVHEKLTKEIKTRTRDAIEKELRETETRLESLKTAEEKRTDLRAKADRLRARLGQ